MPRYCSVVGCKSNDDNKNISFHKAMRILLAFLFAILMMVNAIQGKTYIIETKDDAPSSGRVGNGFRPTNGDDYINFIGR